MQRSLALAFITLLTVSQYAAQLSYLQCRLVNNFSPIVQHCDCEKQDNGIASGNKEFPATKSSTHLPADDFYTLAKTNAFLGHPSLLTRTPFLQQGAALSKGSHSRLYKPPRRSFFIPYTA